LRVCAIGVMSIVGCEKDTNMDDEDFGDEELFCCFCRKPIADNERGHALIAEDDDGEETLLFSHTLCQQLGEFEAHLRR
jgi:hypothetical protein